MKDPNPSNEKFEPLLKSLNIFGLTLDLNSSKTLADSLDLAEIKGNDYFNTIVRISTTRCMEQAVYFSSGDFSSEEYRHYGLAAPIYTHFTSPIRRYADVLVHRLLGASIGIYSLSKELTERETMREICNIMNVRHKMAQYASRSSAELYTQIFFKNKVSEEDAYISKTFSTALILFIPRFGIENYIEFKDKIDFEFDDEKETFKFKNNIKLQIFQKVRVRIECKTSNNYRTKVVVSIIEPKLNLLEISIKSKDPLENEDENNQLNVDEEDEKNQLNVD
jgi:exosome complex exonuclease DIS3/RRP44